MKVHSISEPKWATDFCDDEDQLAITGDFRTDILDASKSKTSQIIIICPQAFTKSEYKDKLVKSGIAVGDHINDWQPKSLTFLHELFHVVRGANMLSGTKDICKSLCFLVLILPTYFPNTWKCLLVLER